MAYKLITWFIVNENCKKVEISDTYILGSRKCSWRSFILWAKERDGPRFFFFFSFWIVSLSLVYVANITLLSLPLIFEFWIVSLLSFVFFSKKINKGKGWAQWVMIKKYFPFLKIKFFLCGYFHISLLRKESDAHIVKNLNSCPNFLKLKGNILFKYKLLLGNEELKYRILCILIDLNYLNYKFLIIENWYV